MPSNYIEPYYCSSTMLTSRLFVNFKILSEITFGNSFSSGGKSHLIKILNYENKYLYGNLIETQKQRRRKITKAVVNEPEHGKLTTRNDDELISEKIQDDSKSRLSEKEPVKARIKKSKKISTDDKEVIVNSKSIKEPIQELSSDQFIFKSRVPISAENYPIVNPEKTQLFSPNCVVKNVYNYTFNDPAVKQSMKFPSVSKVIEDTMSEKNKQVLERWRQNMIKELGEEGFYKQNEATKARGHEFHAAVLHRVLGREAVEHSEVTRNALNSLSWMLDEVSHPMAVESVIAHPRLGYKGVFDCVALFRNIPVVIDWKLSDKPKKDLKDTYDAPVQVTAYIGAINHDPNYKWGVDHGLVAVAYTNGDPCDVFLLAPKHCHIYWRHWLMRLEKFKARSHLHLDHEIDEKALQLT